MMYNDEPLMTLKCESTEEKLLWERFHNKLFLQEIAELKKQLAKEKEEHLIYKDSIINTQNAQMLNKLNKLKKKYEGVDELILSLKSENNKLLCALGQANLKLKECSSETDSKKSFIQSIKSKFKK